MTIKKPMAFNYGQHLELLAKYQQLKEENAKLKELIARLVLEKIICGLR